LLAAAVTDNEEMRVINTAAVLQDIAKVDYRIHDFIVGLRE